MNHIETFLRIAILYELVLKCVEPQNVVPFAVILRVLAPAIHRHVIVTEEKVKCFNGCKMSVSTFRLVPPKNCLFCLNLNLLQFSDVWFSQVTLGLLPCAVDQYDTFDLLQIFRLKVRDWFGGLRREQQKNLI